MLEAEVGYQFPFGMRVTANGFYTGIDDPLIYVYDEDLDEESYFNRGTSATIGAELEVRQRLDEDDTVKLSSELVIGLAVTARNLGVEGLDLTVAAHDLLDTVAQYPQPYRGYHSPLPGQGRQFMLRLA